MKYLPIIGGLLFFAACSKHNSPPINQTDTFPPIAPGLNAPNIQFHIGSQSVYLSSGISYSLYNGFITVSGSDGIPNNIFQLIIPADSTDTIKTTTASLIYYQAGFFGYLFQNDSRLNANISFAKDTANGTFVGLVSQQGNPGFPDTIRSTTGTFSNIPLVQ